MIKRAHNNFKLHRIVALLLCAACFALTTPVMAAGEEEAEAAAEFASVSAANPDVRFFLNEDYPDQWTVYSRSTPNTAATTAANPHGTEGFQTSFGTKCTTCHQVVHGSDFPSQPLSGGGLTR